MTAVDQTGTPVARYRFLHDGKLPVRAWRPRRAPVEIAVHPRRELTEELALALAISADSLASYFDFPVYS